MTTASPLSHALDHAANRGAPSLFQIEGCGSVSVYPQHNCYVTDIQDWELAHQSHTEQITERMAPWGMPPPGALPLTELRWRVAYQGALWGHGSAVAPNELVRLRSWPNLTRLPPELVAPVTQVCALLWRKPVVGFLIARVLQADAAQMSAVLQVLKDLGHIHLSGACAPATPTAMATVGTGDETLASVADQDLAAPAGASMVGKLWRRLTGH